EKPKEFPLSVTRHIEAVGGESTSERVLVRETLDLKAEGLFTDTQVSQYVMDRRKMVNVSDPRAYSYDPANVLDRSGAYRLQFPFDTKSVDHAVFKNEIAASYTAKPVTASDEEVAGMRVLDFTASSDAKPVSPAYLKEINAAVPLPSELTLDQLKPILSSYGLDIDSLLPALLPHLSADDAATLLELSKKPVKLGYLYSFSGADSVEPSTGSIAEVRDVLETMWASPDPAALPPLKATLERYPDVPEAVTAVAALDKIAAQPIKVFENKFSQTADSVEEVAMDIKDQRDKKRLAEETVPTGLLAGGLVLAIVGMVVVALPRRSKGASGDSGEPAAAG
ncbi:MAG TPA: porin PorA family protein, partial [Acidimicrobiales bacterium]